MAIGLKHFAPGEIYITKHDAWTILAFFWPGNGLSERELTFGDINFAQGLLVEAIDASYQMGYVHIVYDVFYGKVPGSFSDIGNIVKEFAKKASKHWFRHLGKKDLAEAEIYAAVRDTLALKFKSVLPIRKATGELIY